MLIPAIHTSHSFRYGIGRVTVTKSRMHRTRTAMWMVGLLSGLCVGFTGCGVCEMLFGVHEIPYGVHEMPFGADAVLSSPLAAPVLPPRTLFTDGS